MNTRLRLPNGRFLTLEPFAVMAIVNVTPDSFYAPSRRGTAEAARDAGLLALENGADIIDIGGESTRPGSDPVSEAEELERVVPAVEALRAKTSAPISVDTKKTSVARAALEAGADIINDISAGTSPGMLETAARFDAGLVLMHMRGEPKTMQAGLEAGRAADAAASGASPVVPYTDCVAEVARYLAAAAQNARAAGIAPDSILLDPGIGFGKRLEDNLALISRLDELLEAGYPLLVGLSRKSFIGAITGRPPESRLAGSIGAALAAYARGARVFRVHDAAETRDALALFASASAGIPIGGALNPSGAGRDPRGAADRKDAAKGGRPWVSD